MASGCGLPPHIHIYIYILGMCYALDIQTEHCFLHVQCPYRFFMCTFEGGCTNLTSAQSLSYDYYQTFPIPILGSPTPFKACPFGIPSFTCSAGVTNQVC